ncbi:hypothetical protein [Halomonas sp. NCCP-2165]|nr:hypothetical protein [Halomonas sp. NCCP-2165]
MTLRNEGTVMNCKENRTYQGVARTLALTAMASSLALGGLAHAEVTSFDDFSSGRQLSDQELGQLRGRFVERGRLVYFGVQMRSEWHTSGGDYLRAETHFRGDLSGTAPRVTFEPNLTMIEVDSGAALPPGNGAMVANAGTDNAYGVVQTIQAGGDFNSATNDFQVDVLSAEQFSGLGQPGQASVERRLDSGIRLAVNQGQLGPGVELNIPGVGRIEQRIAPRLGVRQSIQLSSSGQQVHNLARLELYMQRQPAGSGNVGMRHAVESVRHLGVR